MELDFKEFKEAKAWVAAQARVLAERPERAGCGAATGAAEGAGPSAPARSPPWKALPEVFCCFSRWDRPVHTFKLFLMS